MAVRVVKLDVGNSSILKDAVGKEILDLVYFSLDRKITEPQEIAFLNGALSIVETFAEELSESERVETMMGVDLRPFTLRSVIEHFGHVRFDWYSLLSAQCYKGFDELLFVEFSWYFNSVCY